MICFRHCKALVFWIDRAKHPLRGKRLFSIFGQLFKKASSVVRQLVENSCLRSLKTFVHCTRSKDFKTILLFQRQSNCLRQFLLTYENAHHCSLLMVLLSYLRVGQYEFTVLKSKMSIAYNAFIPLQLHHILFHQWMDKYTSDWQSIFFFKSKWNSQEIYSE